jgi:hypothetical protein
MAVYFDKYLPIERMSTAQRLSRTWPSDTLIYDNDLGALYVGDGATAGGSASGGGGGASAQAPVATIYAVAVGVFPTADLSSPVATPDGGL